MHKRKHELTSTQARTHAPTDIRTPTRAHTHTHARTRARSHTHTCVKLINTYSLVRAVIHALELGIAKLTIAPILLNVIKSYSSNSAIGQ